MNGVGLTAVGRMLGHRNRETTAIYAHLDDSGLRDAAAQAASVIARAMNYKTQPPPLPGEETRDAPTRPPESTGSRGPDSPDWLQTPHWLDSEGRGAETTQPKPGAVDRPPSPTGDMTGSPADSKSGKANEDDRERRRRELLWM
ncbi:MAG: hypothetical protein OXI20_01270 [Rhodospirillales bacterium]|nr:hypothetical protein [Rhodospirillales bacterium]